MKDKAALVYYSNSRLDSSKPIKLSVDLEILAFSQFSLFLSFSRISLNLCYILVFP